MKTDRPWENIITQGRFDHLRKGVDHSDIQIEGYAVGVPFYWPARQIPSKATKVEVDGRPYWMTKEDAHCACGQGKCTFLTIWPADCEARIVDEQPHAMDIDPDRTPGPQKIWVKTQPI